MKQESRLITKTRLCSGTARGGFGSAQAHTQTLQEHYGQDQLGDM